METKSICPHCMQKQKNEDVKFCAYCGASLTETRALTNQLRPFSMLNNRYMVGDILGQGGFGITYIGLDTLLGIRVAIKELYPSGFCTRESARTNYVTIYDGKDKDTVEKWQRRFLDEARALGKCVNLPGIVGVKDIFNENNTSYIVLEYLDGQDLNAFVKQSGGKLDGAFLLNSLEPIVRSLCDVHRQGLIHRDISPDNIRCLPNGSMKLMDFGAARDYESEGDKSLTVALKRGYAPEEQYSSNGDQGPWTDVYALAATIYFCITGRKPPEAMDRIRTDSLQSPRAFNVNITERQEKALMKALSVFAENRFRTMDAFYNALYGNTTETVHGGGMTAGVTGAPVINNVHTANVTGRTVGANTTRPGFDQNRQAMPQAKKGSNKALIFGICALLFVICIGATFLFVMRDTLKDSLPFLAEQNENEEEDKIEKAGKGEDEDSDEDADADDDDEEAEDSNQAAFATGENAFAYHIEEGKAIIDGYSGTSEQLLIPDKIENAPVVRIASLENDNITTITVPQTLDVIDEKAIRCSNLKEMIVHEGLERIGKDAFEQCEKLEKITLPRTIDYIGRKAFSQEFIEKQHEARGVIYLDFGIALQLKPEEKSIKWPRNVRGIYPDFWPSNHGETETDQLEIPNTVEFIGESAFVGYHAKEFIIPKEVRKIESKAIGFDPDGNPYPDVTIRGEEGSEAEDYANKNGFKFKKLK